MGRIKQKKSVKSSKISQKEKLLSELQEIKKINSDLKLENELLIAENEKLKSQLERESQKILGWNIQKSEKYFRAVKKIQGKSYYVYLGKEIKPRIAKGKILRKVRELKNASVL